MSPQILKFYFDIGLSRSDYDLIENKLNVSIFSDHKLLWYVVFIKNITIFSQIIFNTFDTTMTLIDGVGDEVTDFFIIVSVLLVGWLAWCSTSIADQPLIRTVLILQHRTRTRIAELRASGQTINATRIQAPAEPSPEVTEPVESESGPVAGPNVPAAGRNASLPFRTIWLQFSSVFSSSGGTEQRDYSNACCGGFGGGFDRGYGYVQ